MVIGLVFTGCKTGSDTADNTYTLTVTLGNGVTGTPVASSGTVTMNGSHTLNAMADIDVRGDWGGIIYWDCNIDAYIEVTFSGSCSSGTTTGTIDTLLDTGNGTYSTSNGNIEFTLVFPGSGDNITFAGSFSDPNHLSGSYHVVRNNGWEFDGNWEIERQ